MAKRNSRTKRSIRRKAQAKVDKAQDESLPVLDSLTELPAFADLRPSEAQLDAFADYRAEVLAREGDDAELDLGCVVRLDRGFPAVLTRRDVFRAEFAARLTKGDFSRVAVGDWVCVRNPKGHEMGVIEKILPRQSDIARWKGGSRGERQTLAANVDVVLVVQALEEWRITSGRIARSAVVARDCGARVAVVLTKADLAGAELVESSVKHVREVLGGDCRVSVVASADTSTDLSPIAAATERAGGSWGVESVRSLVPHGQVGIMLGPSGVGKSTLLNALLGREALQTGAVRESDGVGRHTTVARRMVAIPKAGVIVDEPGLRTLQLVGHERGLAMAFPDIAQAARECKFRDCTHTHEPGCEVQARFGGETSNVRLDTYLSLANEMRESAQTLDPDIVL
ncbi:MAG: ribosome small subunit-dependent GTPase A [Atopobiaceae bacterium]|jgi:ribosome biogenesis GTPase|nr:ribosome small subunit-dependent GTPase A [Atopobiaceae bacterium]